MITLNAPDLYSDQKQSASQAQSALSIAMAAAKPGYDAMFALRAQEADLRVQSEDLRRKAAAGHEHGVEGAHNGVLRRIAETSEAIRTSDAQAADFRLPLWNAVDCAQSLIQKLSQPALDQLLDLAADAMSPFWSDRDEARRLARSSTAALVFSSRVCCHNVTSGSPIDELYAAGLEVQRKLSALLDGSELWRFHGDAPEDPQRVADLFASFSA